MTTPVQATPEGWEAVDRIVEDIREKLLTALAKGKYGLVAAQIKFGQGQIRKGGQEVKVIERDQPGDRVRAR